MSAKWPFQVIPLSLPYYLSSKEENSAIIAFFPKLILPENRELIQNTPESIKKYYQLVKLMMYQWTWHKLLTSIINVKNPVLIDKFKLIHFPFVFSVDGQEGKYITCAYTTEKNTKKPYQINTDEQTSLVTIHEKVPINDKYYRACHSCICHGGLLDMT